MRYADRRAARPRRRDRAAHPQDQARRRPRSSRPRLRRRARQSLSVRSHGGPQGGGDGDRWRSQRRRRRPWRARGAHEERRPQAGARQHPARQSRQAACSTWTSKASTSTSSSPARGRRAARRSSSSWPSRCTRPITATSTTTRSADPRRLKGSSLAHAGDPKWAAPRDRASWPSKTGSPACGRCCPKGLPVDDPDLDPIFAAMNEANLPIVHHIFFYEAPYFPGYRDVWGNAAFARTAAHVVGRAAAARLRVDQRPARSLPNLRVGMVETGHGWLPNFILRLDKQIRFVVQRHGAARARAHAARVRRDGPGLLRDRGRSKGRR